MNRRHLAFLVFVNALVSLVVALGVVWAFEARRPDLEELAAIYTPRPEPVLAVPAAAAPIPTSSLDATPTPTPPAVESPSPEADPEEQAEEVYIVQPGDTLLGIATEYGLTMDDILRANNLTDPNYLFSGQRLVIPVQGAGGAANDPPPPTNTPIVEGVEIAAVSGMGDLASEQVTVRNDSDTPFSLQGWRLEREGGPSYTFGNVPLFPGGDARLHSGTGTDSTTDLYWNQPNPVWENGAVVRLLNSQGTVVSVYTVQ